MRAPAVIRWPGHIKPGTVLDDIFASLDWLPTLVDIAGGPTGDGLKKQIEAGKYPGIVKTTLDGVDQRAYLRRQIGQVGARHLLLLHGPGPVGGAVQELEDLLLDGGTVRPAGLQGSKPITGPWSTTSSAIPSRARWVTRRRRLGQGGALAGPVTAYLYDWNMLPSARSCG